jgi:uncharacterized protein (UPF0305 family)
MYTVDLLKKLQSDASSFDDDSIKEKLISLKKDIESKQSHQLLTFNLKNMLELKIKNDITENEYIDDKKLEQFEMLINQYMEKYATGQIELKNIVRIISVYRSFIVHKPLHPVEIFYHDGKVIYKNGIPVCPLRAKEITQKEALCHFCNSTIL